MHALVDFVCLPDCSEMYQSAERLFCSEAGEDLMEGLGYDACIFRDMAIQRQDEFQAFLASGDEDGFRDWWRAHFGGMLKIVYAFMNAVGEGEK